MANKSKEISKMREDLLKLTASDLMDNEINTELHLLYVSIADLMMLMKTPRSLKASIKSTLSKRKQDYKERKDALVSGDVE